MAEKNEDFADSQVFLTRVKPSWNILCLPSK